MVEVYAAHDLGPWRVRVRVRVRGRVMWGWEDAVVVVSEGAHRANGSIGVPRFTTFHSFGMPNQETCGSN